MAEEFKYSRQKFQGRVTSVAKNVAVCHENI